MRTLGSRLSWVFLVLVSTAAAAVSHDRDNWRGGREASYQAGYETGFRDGLRHGAFDFRVGARYGYRGRDHFRPDSYYGWAPRPDGHYRKGYRDGYRNGYTEGYRSYHFRPHPYPRREYHYFR
jgi:hypothetical protein